MINRHIILSIILFSLNARSQNTVILEASKDTYINTVIADQYQGHTQSLVAAGWTYGGNYGQGRSLIGFELCALPDSFTLVSAILHLFHDYSADHTGHTTSGLNSAKLYQITSNWDESTTWSSQPTYDLSSFSIVPSSFSETQNYSIDVTGIVNSEIITSTEVDFYFALDEEIIYRSLVFASRNHPDPTVRPRLEIVYYADTVWCDSQVSCEESIVIPNIFSPNGDFANDYFEVEVDCPFTSFHIEILNRWGNSVFESDDKAFVWNGKNQFTDEDLSEGVYFYRITLSDQQTDIFKNGFVTIVR